jgi:hypothetical protein
MNNTKHPRAHGCSISLHIKKAVCEALRYLPVFILASVSVLRAAVFSPVNRYQLSCEYYTAINEQTFEDSCIIWYSLPNETNIGVEDRFLQFRYNDDTLVFNASGVAGIETHNTDAIGHGIARFKADLLGKYLDAHVDLYVFPVVEIAHEPFSEVEYERFISRHNEHISGFMEFGVNAYESYLKAKIRAVEIRIGKQKIRWGPGYKATLGLSGTSYAPFYFHNTTVSFGSLFKFHCFLNAYDDEWYFYREASHGSTNKIAHTLRDSVTDDFPRFGAGQRIDLRINRHIQFGMYELCNFFHPANLVRYANPFQLYYLGQNDGPGKTNLLAGCDINVIIDPVRIYAELLNDDVTVFEDAGNPNKYGYQCGMVLYGKQHIVQAGIEYTHIKKYVYSNYEPLTRHTYFGQSLGWPWGNDQDVFTVHSIARIRDDLNARAELSFWLKGDGVMTGSWRGDGSPDMDHVPYWPENATRSITGVFGATYRPRPWLRLDFFYRPAWSGISFSHSIFAFVSADLPDWIDITLK